MNRTDEIRQKAAEAAELADQAMTDADKASWLRLAQSWLTLLNKPQGAAEQRFEDQVLRDGTKQTGSKGSH